MTLKEAIEILKSAGVDSPEYDARELFKKYGNQSSPVIMLSASSDSKDLINAVERRATREPLQYILGEVGFYREEYLVSPDCLIPRSDTEMLVDYAVKHIPKGESFADLCSGSGCVGISVLANTKGTECTSVDISKKAIECTRLNSVKNGVAERLTTLTMDLLGNNAELPQKFFAILSNPPYIPEEVYNTLEDEIFYEPRIAFVGDDEGMAFYNKLLPLSLLHLKENGFIGFEIGYDQGEKITQLAAKHSCTCEIIKDYSGNDRVAVIKRK